MRTPVGRNASLYLPALLILCSSIAAAAQVQAQSTPTAEEIVITANRSGIPVWRVSSATSTLVLVGTVTDLADGTKWEPSHLLTALRQADQVLFPAEVQHTASVFNALRWSAKARELATLPKGRTVAQYVTASDYQRLYALQQRGVLSADFYRKHPLQLVQELVRYSKGERPSRGFISVSKVDVRSDPEAFVRSAVRKYRIPLVPTRKAKMKPVIADIFAASPGEHGHCLRAAITLAEAGPAAFRERSSAWAQRQVANVLESSAQHALDACRPAAMRQQLTPDIRAAVTALLSRPGTTVAVVDLPLLARHRGILDQLVAAGFQVRGPVWN